MQRSIIIGIVVVAVVGAGLAIYLATGAPPQPPTAKQPDAVQPASPEAKPARTATPANEKTSQESVAPAGVPEAPSEETAAPVAGQEGAMVRVYGTVTVASAGSPVAGARVFQSSPMENLGALGGPFGRGRFSGAQLAALSKAKSGSSVPGGPLSTLPPEALRSPETKTDADGVFELRVPAASSKFSPITCLSAGYARVSKRVQTDQSECRVDFQLLPGSIVSGTITDRGTDQGIAGVSVRAMNATQNPLQMLAERGQGRGERWEGTTNDKGEYMVEGLAAGSYRIVPSARAQGYIFRAEDARTLSVEEGRVYEGVDYHLEPGASVEGAVRDSGGAAVANVFVTVVPGKLMETMMKGLGALEMFDQGSVDTTDESGSYGIAGLDYDTEFRIQAQADGFANAKSDAFKIARGESPVRVDLVLPVGSQVSGLARYSDGKPAGKSGVSLFPDPGAMLEGMYNEPKNTQTNDRGEFAFEHVSAGKYLLHGSGTPFFNPFGETKNVPVEVDGVNPVKGLEVVIEASDAEKKAPKSGTGNIEGTVVDAHETPVGGAPVTAANVDDPDDKQSATTVQDGTFKLAELKGRRYNVSVTCDAGRCEQKSVAVGGKITLRLSPPTSVSGVVVDAQSQPVANCQVKLEPSDKPAGPDLRGMMGGMFGGQKGVETDVNGFFEVLNPEPGAFSATAESSSKGTGRSTPFTVVAGQSVSGLRIVLQAGSKFSGTVTNAQGRAVENANVRLVPTGANQMENMMAQFMPAGLSKTGGAATSDADGRFSIANVSAGTYSVEATHGDYAKTLTPNVVVEQGRDVTGYSILLARGGGMSGRLMENGQAKPGVMIQIMGPSGMQMITTDAEGRFNVTGLAAGSYIVQSIDMGQMASQGFAGGMQPRQRVIDIQEGGNLELDELFPQGGAAVTGAISGIASGSLTTISLRRPGGPAPEGLNRMDLQSSMEAMRYQEGTSIVGQDGAFSLQNVAPGTYILEVMSIDMSQFNPQNPDMEALMNMDHTPQIRQEVQVGEGPLELNLELPPKQR